MKKIFVLLSVLVPAILFAQPKGINGSYSFTPNGFVNSKDTLDAKLVITNNTFTMFYTICAEWISDNKPHCSKTVKKEFSGRWNIEKDNASYEKFRENSFVYNELKTTKKILLKLTLISGTTMYALCDNSGSESILFLQQKNDFFKQITDGTCIAFSHDSKSN